MSLHEYRAGLDIAQLDAPFYALIQAAMRKADTINEYKLRAAWPEVWDDLQARYNAPGGILEGEDAGMTTFYGDPDNPHTGTVREITGALDNVRSMTDRVQHIAHHSRTPVPCRKARKVLDAALKEARRVLLEGLAEAKAQADAVDLAHIEQKAMKP